MLELALRCTHQRLTRPGANDLLEVVIGPSSANCLLHEIRKEARKTLTASSSLLLEAAGDIFWD